MASSLPSTISSSPCIPSMSTRVSTASASSSRRRSAPAASSLMKGSKKAPRSRNGCWTCRNRKIKCDELHPRCTPCTRLKIACDYTRRLNYKDDTPRIMVKMSSMIDTTGCPVYDDHARRIFTPYQSILSGDYEEDHDNGFVNFTTTDFSGDLSASGSQAQKFPSLNYDDSDGFDDDEFEDMDEEVRYPRAKAASLPVNMLYSHVEPMRFGVPASESSCPTPVTRIDEVHSEFGFATGGNAIKNEFVLSSSPFVAGPDEWYYQSSGQPSAQRVHQSQQQQQQHFNPQQHQQETDQQSVLSAPKTWSDSASTCSSWSRPSSSPSSPLDTLRENSSSDSNSCNLFMGASQPMSHQQQHQHQQQQPQYLPCARPTYSALYPHNPQQKEFDDMNNILASNDLSSCLRMMLADEKSAPGTLPMTAHPEEYMNQNPRLNYLHQRLLQRLQPGTAESSQADFLQHQHAQPQQQHQQQQQLQGFSYNAGFGLPGSFAASELMY